MMRGDGEKKKISQNSNNSWILALKLRMGGLIVYTSELGLQNHFTQKYVSMSKAINYTPSVPNC